MRKQKIRLKKNKLKNNKVKHKANAISQIATDLAIRAKAGDKNAQDQLILQLQPIILWVIKRTWVPNKLFQDCLQEANLGIYEAINRYNPRLSSFTNYVIIYIFKQITQYVAANDCFTTLSVATYNKY